MNENRKLIASKERPEGILQLWEHIMEGKKEYELVVNGIFIMATYNGLSSELLVRNAVSCIEVNKGSILIGGLGLGYSVKEAVLHQEELEKIKVIELDDKIIDWNKNLLKDLHADFVNDDRVMVVNADFVDYVYRTKEKYNIICMDIDNGPMLISNTNNVNAYSKNFYKRVSEILYPGGVFVIWSCNEDHTLLDDMNTVFDRCFCEVVYEPMQGEEIPYYLYFGIKRNKDSMESLKRHKIKE